jgi:hypothetical protein
MASNNGVRDFTPRLFLWGVESRLLPTDGDTDMPTEAEIITLTSYPNNQPIAPSLLEPLPGSVVLVLEHVRKERRACFVYIIEARTLYVAYPVADSIARMDIHFVPDDIAATKLFEAFGKAQADKRHGRALREHMLDAHVRITGIEPD